MKTFEIFENRLDETELSENEFFLPDVHFEREGVTRVGIARIATNLEKLIQPNLTKDSQVAVVGNDGPNISDPEYPHWRKCLVDWLDRGCNITYLLLRPNTDAAAALRDVKTGVTGDGKLAAFRVNQAKLTDEARRYVAQWRTFHFIIAEKPKQLWIECRHELGETHAEDCAYFSTPAAEKAALFSILRARFNYVLRNCTDLVET
jgi:hypothetical protein